MDYSVCRSTPKSQPRDIRHGKRVHRIVSTVVVSTENDSMLGCFSAEKPKFFSGFLCRSSHKASWHYLKSNRLFCQQRILPSAKNFFIPEPASVHVVLDFPAPGADPGTILAHVSSVWFLQCFPAAGAIQLQFQRHFMVSLAHSLAIFLRSAGTLQRVVRQWRATDVYIR